MMKAIRRFVRLPASERRVLIEAVALCTWAGLLLKVMRFPRLASRLGRHMAETPAEPDKSSHQDVIRIRWAIAAAARYLPWKPVCLPQAVTAQWMLRRHGIPSTLYLGIDPAQGYDAHAWVRAGTVIVTGGPRQERYAVVSSFA